MEKTHINVGTIGHIDHGKTTLTAAILAVQARKGLARPKSYQDISRGGNVGRQQDGHDHHQPRRTRARSGGTYAHIDYPATDYVRDMMPAASKMDAQVLLISAPAHRSGTPDPGANPAGPAGRRAGDLVVFVNKVPVNDLDLSAGSNGGP